MKLNNNKGKKLIAIVILIDIFNDLSWKSVNCFFLCHSFYYFITYHV